jgi:hypothetical protein
MNICGSALAAVFSPWPANLVGIFPEVKLSGVHRHLPLAAWGLQVFRQKKWCLLIMPQMLGINILDIPEDMKQQLLDLHTHGKCAVYDYTGDEIVCSVAMVRSRPPRATDHDRCRGTNDHTRISTLIDTIISNRKDDMTPGG